MKIPYIFDIVKASFADGPGMRTVVFLKGCPLSCLWCQNPESRSPEREVFFSPEKCIQCGNCKQGKDCFTRARQVIGKRYNADELVRIILQDKAYYLSSSGGVTFSGGEPSLFMDYLHEVFLLLKKVDIHITFQTCGYFHYHEFAEKLLPFINLIHFDIKLMDAIQHIKYTGVSNERILQNFRRLTGNNIPVIPRVTLVPEITATKKNLTSIAEFLGQSGIDTCEFLMYNPSGIDKLVRLGKTIPGGIPPAPLPADEETSWINFFYHVVQKTCKAKF